MSGSRPDGSTPRHAHRLLVGSFLALLIVTSGAFAVTTTGYFATEKAGADTIIVGTVTDYRVDESGDRPTIVVDVEVENPTMQPVKLDSANLDATVNGTTVARGATGLDETVPAGESKTITLELIPREGYRSTAVAAAESGSLSVGGLLWARIQRFRFEIAVLADGGERA